MANSTAKAVLFVLAVCVQDSVAKPGEALNAVTDAFQHLCLVVAALSKTVGPRNI